MIQGKQIVTESEVVGSEGQGQVMAAVPATHITTHTPHLATTHTLPHCHSDITHHTNFYNHASLDNDESALWKKTIK